MKRNQEQAGRKGNRKMDEWMVYASSGEYSIKAENAGEAYAQFTATHDDDFVLAIVNDAMQPPLILAEN